MGAGIEAGAGLYVTLIDREDGGGIGGVRIGNSWSARFANSRLAN